MAGEFWSAGPKFKEEGKSEEGQYLAEEEPYLAEEWPYLEGW